MPRKVQTSATLNPIAKVKKAAPAPNQSALLERFKDFPSIDVITRRFNDPNDPGSLPILLKDEDAHCCTSTDHQNVLPAGATVCPVRAMESDEHGRPRRTGARCGKPIRKWYVRYFNLAQEGRNAQMRSKGYVPVEVKDLADADDISDLYTGKDAYVRRGDRGQELLGKMPLELWLEIKRRQRVARTSRAVSTKHLRDDLAEGAARSKDDGGLGSDQAADEIYDGAIKVESMRRVRTTLADEADLASKDADVVDA